MKITSVPSMTMPTSDSQGNLNPSRVDSMRTLKMTTNVTTPFNPQPPQLSIPDMGEDKTEAPVADTQPLSPQLALLAKQRRALQVKEREIADREKALSQTTGTPGIDVARFKSDPVGVMEEHGITYDQLTEAILSRGNPSDRDRDKEMESLKQIIDQKFTEKTTAEEQHVLAEMKREAEQRIKADDEFEFIRERGEVPTVLELIKRTYRETGEVLQVEEALRLVEDELFKDSVKLANLKKMQKHMQSQMAPQFQPQQRQQGMRTLTNKDTASVPLSAKARAMAAFYGTLPRR